MRTPFILFAMFIIVGSFLNAQHRFEEDIISTSQGDLKITFIGHGTLYLSFGGRIVHIDPVGRYADYSGLPKADLILVTHEHGDHLDLEVIKLLSTEKTDLVFTQKCMDKVNIPNRIMMRNGDSKTVQGIQIEAVPAYNIKHMRSQDNPFHPKGEGNGYVLTFGDKRIYIAGDTENIPEMKELTDIEAAFLPMNLPYTMTPEMVADAARSFRPKILYPYHYGNTDPQELVMLLKDEKDIEVRIRDMK